MEGLVGRRIGKYQVIREVGRGGMGTVYQGYDPSLQRYVAIKVLAPHLRGDSTFTERFIREARTAARLYHPNIVHIHEVGQEGGLNYFVMEYLEGESLKALIQRQGRLPPAQVLGILRQVASALDYVHAQGIIHRDVKPANIVITSGRRAVLTDLGIGRAIGDARLTSTGTALGTPEYMAPEQARGDDAGPPADLYALAVVAYELLAGRVPFHAESGVAILFRVIHEPHPPLRQWRPDLPPAVDAVMNQALAKSPQSRYSSGQAFIQSLERTIGATEQPTMIATAESPGAWPGAVQPPARRPALALWMGLGVVGVVLFTLLGVSLFRTTDSRPPATLVRSTAALSRTALPTTPPTVPPAVLNTARPRPSSSPTPDPQVEITAALEEYTRIRAEAEQLLNPDLLHRVCVDPYLSWKIARIQENIRDGTRWETWSTNWQITSLSMLAADQAAVWVRKTETKVFFPRGSSLPDDQVCKGTIYSYRDCTYDAYYVMVRQNGRWYVSNAQSPDADCERTCQR